MTLGNLRVLLVLLIAGAIIVPVSVIAASQPAGSGAVLNSSPSPSVEVMFAGESPVPSPTVTTTARGIQTRRSGEVEHPITHPIRPFTPSPTPVPVPPVVRETEHRTPVPTIIPPPRTTPPVTFRTPTPPPIPTPLPTTLTPTPVISTPATVQTVIVTVTVPVYPSGPVYSPLYYYPPGYGYPIYNNYPSGTLTVTSDPTNAVVILDGYNSETTPWVFTGLVQGYHTVEIDYPGYEAYVTNVYLDNGANQEIDARLSSLQTYGSMVIQSSPTGAGVFIDGNYEGTTPVTVGGLTEGIHQVELHLGGYMVKTSMERVTAGQGTVVNQAMAPYSVSTSEGSINIASTVPGALVYLDGTYKGSVRSGSTFNIVAVDPGSHTLLLHAPGYADFSQTTDVNPAGVAYVTADFAPAAAGGANPSPAPGQAGSLTVTSQPSGGQVFVDQQFRGVAPVTIYNVAPGDHIINMKLAGYNDWSSSVSVAGGQAAQVTATLSPGSGATPAPTRAGIPVSLTVLAAAMGILICSPRRK